MNKKGFTVVELITTFALVAVISILLIKLVVTLKEIYINGDLKTTLITKQSTMTDKIYKDLKNENLTKIESCTEDSVNCIKFVYDSKTKILEIDTEKKSVTYDNYTIKLGDGGYFGEPSIDKYNSDVGSILNLKLPIYNKLVKGNYGLNITYQFDNKIDFDNDIAFEIKDTGVTVTFDANGGTVDTTKKQVTVGNTYGKLPVPEREGYEFKGWNGKNKFDQTGNSINAYIGNQKINNYGSDRKVYYFDAKPNTNYTVSKKRNLDNDRLSIAYSTTQPAIDVSVSGEQLAPYLGTVGELMSVTTTTNSNAKYILVWAYWDNNTNSLKSIQLEEGSTATEYEPYYVQSNTKVTQNKNHTLTAIWEKKEATFMVGRDFNAKIKQLAGDTNGAYNTENTSITSVKRYNKKPSISTLNSAQIVSTNDSKYPIYAWFNNGTIYYYTEALNPYMNANGTDMFQYLTNATSIDINTIDTSKTTQIQGLFNLDRNLKSLDLSNFDTSIMTNMYAPFQHCESITSLDLSSFDMSKVLNTSGMIYGMNSLTTLKTPKKYPTDSYVSIPLPATFKDSSNNTYTSLNNTSPTKTTLTKQ